MAEPVLFPCSFHFVAVVPLSAATSTFRAPMLLVQLRLSPWAKMVLVVSVLVLTTKNALLSLTW